MNKDYIAILKKYGKGYKYCYFNNKNVGYFFYSIQQCKDTISRHREEKLFYSDKKFDEDYFEIFPCEHFIDVEHNNIKYRLYFIRDIEHVFI